MSNHVKLTLLDSSFSLQTAYHIHNERSRSQPKFKPNPSAKLTANGSQRSERTSASPQRKTSGSKSQDTSSSDRRSPKPRRSLNENNERSTRPPRQDSDRSRSRGDRGSSTPRQSPRPERRFAGKTAEPREQAQTQTMPAPHDWQPSRKRAEELFGGTSSVLPADFDFDVMTDVDSGSNSPKWDGGKGQ
jgi:hypothetical protein